MIIYNIFKKIFLSVEWQIAVRRRVSPNKYADSFISVPNNHDYWFADPLFFKKDEDNIYIFCEAFARKEQKGKLGYFFLDNGVASNFKLIIDEDYHMSFPTVFKYDGCYYMIPESGENLSLDLYKAKIFPDEWVKVKSLIKGCNYVDPTIVEISGRIFLFVYVDKEKEYQTRIYEITTDLNVELIQTIDYTQNIGRSAGKVFINHKNEMIRPAQMSEGEYGKETLFYKLEFNNNCFVETLIETIDNKMVKINGKAGVSRIHTYCRCGDYEAIDYTRYKFDIFKRIKILIRKYKMMQRRKRKM